jgi:hypothetical protein
LPGFGAGRRILLPGSRSRKTQAKSKRERIGKSHNGVRRIVSHRCPERKRAPATIHKKPGKRFGFPGSRFILD